MARKPNLLVKIAAFALAAAQRELPDYSHPHSPHRYTQPQLMACLILRAYLKATYRQIVDLLEVSDILQKTLGLKNIPRHTTLEEFASRVATADLLDRTLATVLTMDGRPVIDIAGDSTGLSTSGASAHYIARSGKKGGHYLKLSVVIACTVLLPVTMAFSRGPCNDLIEANELLWKTAARCSPIAAYFDSGYDRQVDAQVFSRWPWLRELHSPGDPHGRWQRLHAVPRPLYHAARSLRPSLARRKLLQRPEALDRQRTDRPHRPRPTHRSQPPRPGLRHPTGMNTLLDTAARRQCYGMAMKNASRT